MRPKPPVSGFVYVVSADGSWMTGGCCGGGDVIVMRFSTYAEAEFLDIIGTKVFKVFLLAINSHLY